MVQTKVTPWAKARLKSIERFKGLNDYALLQMMCETIILYMDQRHNLSEGMEKAMSIFEHLDGWNEALSLVDPNTDRHIGEAIYFLYDTEGKKKGARAVHVTKPFFGNWTEDANIQNIIERVLQLMVPERYKKMKQLAADLGCPTILALLDHFIDHFIKEEDLAELRRPFEDADRASNNRPLAYGQRTRRKRHVTPDDMEGDQHIIRFGPEDADIEDDSTY